MRYRCEDCGGTFDKARSTEEAEREAFENFGVRQASTHPGMALVCDDCYQEIMAAMHASPSFVKGPRPMSDAPKTPPTPTLPVPPEAPAPTPEPEPWPDVPEPDAPASAPPAPHPTPGGRGGR